MSTTKIPENRCNTEQHFENYLHLLSYHVIQDKTVSKRGNAYFSWRFTF